MGTAGSAPTLASGSALTLSSTSNRFRALGEEGGAEEANDEAPAEKVQAGSASNGAGCVIWPRERKF